MTLTRNRRLAPAAAAALLSLALAAAPAWAAPYKGVVPGKSGIAQANKAFGQWVSMDPGGDGLVVKYKGPVVVVVKDGKVEVITILPAAGTTGTWLFARKPYLDQGAFARDEGLAQLVAFPALSTMVRVDGETGEVLDITHYNPAHNTEIRTWRATSAREVADVLKHNMQFDNSGE